MTARTRTARLVPWTRALGRWLWEARLAWLAVATLLGAALAVGGNPTEARILLTGLVLQILGIGTVAWGIRTTRRLFGRPGMVALVRTWLANFPRYGGRTIAVGATMTATSSVRGRAFVTTTAADESVEARLDALEKNMGHVNDRINGIQAEIDQKADEHRRAFEEERQARSKEAGELRERLEATETGGLHVSAVGAVWLTVGVALSTAAPELARWLG